MEFMSAVFFYLFSSDRLDPLKLAIVDNRTVLGGVRLQYPKQHLEDTTNPHTDGWNIIKRTPSFLPFALTVQWIVVIVETEKERERGKGTIIKIRAMNEKVKK